MKCQHCRKNEGGSVGATGLRWETICQPCKDAIDRGTLAQAVALCEVGRALDRHLDKIISKKGGRL